MQLNNPCWVPELGSKTESIRTTSVPSWGQANKELSPVSCWPATKQDPAATSRATCRKSAWSHTPQYRPPLSSLLVCVSWHMESPSWIFALLLLSFQHSHENFCHLAHPNNNFSTLRVEFVRKYYTQHYLCKLHPQLLMCLFSDALPLPIPLKSLPITPPRNSHFQNYLKRIYYGFKFVLSFWKYLAALVCNVFLMLQITFFLTTEPETHEKSSFYLQKLCLIHFTWERKKVNLD